MPRGDGTGPLGLGPMSGWGAGFCHGYDRPGYANPGSYYGGRYRGGGFYGSGRGWCHWHYRSGLSRWNRFGRGQMVPFGPALYPPLSPEEEVEELKSQASYFEESLKEIKRHIAELEEQAGKEE